MPTSKPPTWDETSAETAPSWDDTRPDEAPKWEDTRADLSKVKGQPVNQPSMFSSGLPAGTPDNPDWGAVSEFANTHPEVVRNPLAPISKALGFVQQRILEPLGAEVAKDIFINPPAAGEPAIPLTEESLLRASDVGGTKELEDDLAKNPVEPGFQHSVLKNVEGFTTPGNLITLPFVEFKPVQAAFLAGTVANMPDQVQSVLAAKTPAEVREAATDLGISLAFAEMLRRGVQQTPAKEAAKMLRENVDAAPDWNDTAPAKVQTEVGPGEIMHADPVAGTFNVRLENGQWRSMRREQVLSTEQAAPTPESPDTVQAQVDLTADPNSSKAATHVTPGEAMPKVPEGLVTRDVPNDQGTVIVNPAKADPDEVAAAAATGAHGKFLGMSTDDKPVGADVVLQTKNAAGVPVQDEVVTPESLPAAISAAKAVAPDGATELKPAGQVIAERQQPLSDMDLARRTLEQKGKLSVSMLQRLEKLPYARAQAAVAALEKAGEIYRPNPMEGWIKTSRSSAAHRSPPEGIKISPAQWADMANYNDYEQQAKFGTTRAKQMQALALSKVNEKTLAEGKWPNGDKLTAADRKRLKTEIKVSNAELNLAKLEQSAQSEAVQNERQRKQSSTVVEGLHGGSAEEAAGFIRAGSDSVPSSRGTANEIRRQSARLRQWAEQRRAVIDYQPPPDAIPSKGAEHEVFFHPKEQRVYKRTYPGTFGSVMTERGTRRIATPHFYLQRLALMNKFFDADMRLEGITPDKNFSTVISQPLHVAIDPSNPLPAPEQVAATMKNAGFKQLGPFDWMNEAEGVRASDTRPDNFILTERGAVPIDLIMEKIEGAEGGKGKTEPQPPTAPTATDTPPQAAAKIEEQVQDVAKNEGSRPAKEIKSELVDRLERELADAPGENDLTMAQRAALEKARQTDAKVLSRDRFGPGGRGDAEYAKALPAARSKVEQTAIATGLSKVTIHIPGDGDFTVWKTKEALNAVLREAKRIETKPGIKGAQFKYTPNKLSAAMLEQKAAEDAVRVYGNPLKARDALSRQLANADALELSPEQKSLLNHTVELLHNSVFGTLEKLRAARDSAQESAAENRRKAADITPAELRQGNYARAEQRRYLAIAAERDKEVARLTAAVDGQQAQIAKWEKENNQATSGRTAAKEPNGSADVQASPPRELAGGELGEQPPGPVPPEDDSHFSNFDAVPMEMPEAVRVVKALTGLYPRIKEHLRALGGNAAGVFISRNEGPVKEQFTKYFPSGRAEVKAMERPGKGRVELLARLFDLLSPPEKEALRQQAFDYAKATAEEGDNVERLAQERYEYLLQKAYESAKTRNPVEALKVIWHEIGHVVDWLPEHVIRERGNLFGHIASLKGYFEKVLPLDPDKPSGKEISKEDQANLRAQAEKQIRDEIGPIREIVKTIIFEEPEWKITGITPQDVTNILREGAGKDTPELTRWFAEQDSKVKADVLRKAMRGLLDERLSAMGKKEQIGVRRTEKTVREKVGREPTQEEIKARLAELLQKEMRARNLADLATVQRELEPLIAWWRGTKTMESYFRPATEMYAEAFSAWANNPAAVLKRAPTYSRLIWEYLDRKPQVKALYDAIQTQIKKGDIMPQRVADLYASWEADDVRSLKNAREYGQVTRRDIYDNVAYHFDRRFGPVYRAAKGYAGEGRLREAIGTFLYRAAEHERFLAALNNDVGKVLVKAGLDWTHDFGEYLFHKRVVMERFNLANPLGWTSKNSLERLGEMQAKLGPERWAALERAGAEFRRLYEKHVVNEVNGANMFTPELAKVLEDRAHYATFSAIKDVPDNGIEKIIAGQYGSGVTPHIYRQIGNLGEIKNPATATVLKGLSLISAAYRNTMKAEVVRMLREQSPDEITEAKRRWNGKTQEPIIIDKPGVGTIAYLEGGKLRAYYVRKVLADAVNMGAPAENHIMRALVNATGWMKGLFTQLNYGFWPVNMVRDTAGFVMQMPGVATPYHLARILPRALKAARESVTHSQPNPYADAALARKMLISKGDPRGVYAAAENEYELKLASFGMDPAQWDAQGKKANAIVRAWNFYRELGATGERVNKIAGMIYLDEKFPNMPEWKKREIVRERSGSPDFLQRGASNAAADLLFLFYNPWKEGVRSVVRSARENPFSFTAKATVGILAPTILQAAAVNGWLGEERKRQYQAVGDYFLSNYLVVPLGWADRKQGKVVALKLPLWEPARVAHGTLFQVLTGRGQGIMSNAGGQLPSLNPVWQTGLAWSEYMLGDNPPDLHRGTGILTDTQQRARGLPAFEQMAKWTWNTAGGGILNRFQNLNLESPPETVGEDLLNLPLINNALGRWILVTDRGNVDHARQLNAEAEQHHAQIRLGVQEIIRKMTAGEAFTPSERMLLREPYAAQYLMEKYPQVIKQQASPVFRELQRATTPQGKAAVLQGR